ncbi:unnamed protein product [Dovyalis caffra]|uniref:Uncharacterized protein n=1 Tax=Dovyalis caffra TaxID=77055 RepID=A0AAV1S1V3_9ROSI|nr:unnamed protein product [Dovyalis caffra]
MLKLANTLGPLPTSWNKTSSNNFCISWHWLDCDSSGRVIDINLVDQHLTGTLPPELSNLTELKSLHLKIDLAECTGPEFFTASHSNITGSIPDILGSFSNLQKMQLSSTTGQMEGLIGTIDVLTSMSQLSLQVELQGVGVSCDQQVTTLLEIAGALGYPVNLSDNWKGNNACDWAYWTCPIPDSLTKLMQLNILDVSNNNLSGKVLKFRPPLKLTIKPGKALLEMGMDTGVGKNPDTNATEETDAKKAGVCLPVMLFLPFLL